VYRGPAQARRGGRPYARVEKDPQNDPKDRRSTSKPGHSHQRQNVGAFVQKVSLRVNQKALESGNKDPPPRRVRNRQFRHISEKRDEFASRRSPIVSINTKKKELVGNFKNQGVS
jgi:hypothetical protein